jgi:hypothetical protein
LALDELNERAAYVSAAKQAYTNGLILQVWIHGLSRYRGIPLECFGLSAGRRGGYQAM